jgi:nucleotide-binding universal stress UspA family protein
MRWQTLLVPHDYSPCADRALAMAADLARLHQARIVLLHVTHLPPGLTADAQISDSNGNMIRVDTYSAAAAQRELEGRAAPLRQSGLTVDVVNAMGNVADEIVEMAGVEKADLIVMGTHGRTGLAHVLLGSMTEKVLRQAPVPVLTVRDEKDPRRTTSDVVLTDYATD